MHSGTHFEGQPPLTAVLDQMAVGLGVFNGQGELFHSNHNFDTLTGGSVRSSSCFLGPEWQGFDGEGLPLGERDHPVLKALSGEVATPPLEFLRSNPDGSEACLGISAVPVTMPASSAILGAVVVIEDYTHRREARIRAKAAEQRFRRFAQFSSNTLWIANPDTGAVEYLSPAADKMWGHGQPVATMQDWLSHIHDDDHDHVIATRAQVARGDVRRLNYRIVDAAGMTCRQVRETCFPMPATSGEEACIGGIVETASAEQHIYLVHRAGMLDERLMAELRKTEHRIKCFSAIEQLMEIADILNPGCVVVDLRGAPDPTPSLNTVFAARPADLQMIFIGPSDTPRSQIISAMRAGAIDFLIEPLNARELAEAIHAAYDALPSRFDQGPSERSEWLHRISALPRREREVFLGLIGGKTNKMIARDLGISPRTVEVHRAHLMERLGAKSLSKLMEIAHRAGVARSEM